MTTTHPALAYLAQWAKYQAVEPSFWKLIDATRMQLSPAIKGQVFTDLAQVNNVLLGRGALRNEMAREIESTLNALDDVDPGERDTLRNLLSVQRSVATLSLAAFRSTKFIIRLDPDMAKLLMNTQVPAQLPSSVFRHLPAWSFYLEIPESIRADSCVESIHGAYVTLAASNGKPALLVVALGEADGVAKPAVHFIREFGDTIDMEKFIDPDGIDPHRTTEKVSVSDYLLRYITLAAMYMSSKEPDYSTPVRPFNPTAVRSARGMIFNEKSEASVLSLGYRIGAAINAASKESARASPGETTGRIMPAHLRKAHWHHFWTGQRPVEGSVDNRKLVLHFLPPIPVNLDNTDQLVATVRPLEAPNV